MAKAMNIGIVGCGRAAQQLHLPALNRLTSAHVIMASDINEENLQGVQLLAPRAITSTDYNQVLRNPEIDIVAIFTPAYLHTEIATKALDAGKHVFIEKPLALTLNDCDKLLKVQGDSNRSATVGFNLRFHRLVSKAQSLIREGVIGHIEAMRSVSTGSLRQKRGMPSWRSKRELGGSVLFEVGVHHFDLWKYLLAETIEEISAVAKIEDGIERSIVVNATSRSGIPISALFSDWTADSNELEIYGDRGVITISLYRIDGLRYYSLADFSGGMSTRLKELKQLLADAADYPKSISLGGDFKSTFYYEWQNFISDIQNKKSTSPRLEDGRYATKVALAASQSVLSKLPVGLQNSPAQVSAITTLE